MLVHFLLVVQFMLQIKFNFNNFIFYGVSATAC